MPISLQVKNIDKLVASFAAGVGARPTIRMGLQIVGPAAKYALVWEWGSSTLSAPGPKTTWGINPDGDIAILTLTAPYGYIRVHKPEFRQIIREELKKINWAGVKPSQLRKRASVALAAAMVRCAALVSESAPYDTGELSTAIVAITQDSGGGALEDTLTVRPRVTV